MVAMEEISGLFEELEENYMWLHKNPELGFEEQKTSEFIMRKLKEYGIEGKKVAGTGAIATIKGEKEGKTIAIRADMDALPLTEQVDVPYRSRSNGVMHACGHDAHVTMLLGAAHYFSMHRNQLKGNVRLIFQPAEEGFDFGKIDEIVELGGSKNGGAASMIACGALEGVDACFALHVFPELETGTLAAARDRAMASSDVFKIDICGRGGHGSSPETAVDPTGALAALLTALNAFPSRELSPLESCALSVGVIQTDSAWNIIPDKIHVEGGIRTFNNELREHVFERLHELTDGICKAHRCTFTLERIKGYEPTINSIEISEQMVAVANQIFGEGKGILLEKPTMGSEDVGYYFQTVPGAMGWLGCREEGTQSVALHNPNFKLNLKSLRNGVLFHLNMVLDYMYK